MKVTPLDLRQQRFKTVMRGYDRGEVQAFLLEVADDYENALRENDKLRQDVAKLDAVLAEHRGQERNLRNTLLTAQKHADDIKEHAQTEAGLIMREAEGQRDLLLQKAQARLEDVQREIDGLRMKRREVENDIEALVRTLNSTLEFIRDQDARSRDERILLHRPRAAEDAGRAGAEARGCRRQSRQSARPTPNCSTSGWFPAGRSGIAGLRDGALLVRLAAAPVDGAANAELIAVLGLRPEPSQAPHRDHQRRSIPTETRPDRRPHARAGAGSAQISMR